MGTFLKFLVSLVVSIVWQRVGGKGAIPPVRLPKGKKPVDIPVVSPWQMMAAMWVAKRLWGSVGEQVKTSLATSSHPAARQVGALLPDPPAKPAAKTTSPAPKAAAPKSPFFKAPVAPPAPHTPQTWTTAAQPTTPSDSSAPSSPRPSQDFGTRKLDDTDPAPDNASNSASDDAASSTSTGRISGLLSSLRRGKGH